MRLLMVPVRDVSLTATSCAFAARLLGRLMTMRGEALVALSTAQNTIVFSMNISVHGTMNSTATVAYSL